MEMSMEFANMSQATSEDQSAVSNLTMANSTLTEQVALYVNCLSTKEVYSMAIQTAIKKLQGEVKNTKAEVDNLKIPGHSGGTGAANKDNSIIITRWK